MTHSLSRRVVIFALSVAVAFSVALAGQAYISRPASAAGTSAVRDKLGFYPDGSANVTEFNRLESWLGRPVNVIIQFSDSRPGVMPMSVWNQLKVAGSFNTRAAKADYSLAIPLAVTNIYTEASTASGRAQIATLLDEVTNGKWDNDYRATAQYLIDGGYPDAILRLGWEMTGGWFTWSSNGNEQKFINAYRHVAALFRSYSPKFRFDWNPTHMNTQSQFDAVVAKAYPGDDVVDIMGLDIYDMGVGGTWNSTTKSWADPAGVWNASYLPGLKIARDFAIKHGKQVSYPEWGMSGGGYENPQRAGGDNPYFVQAMYDWMSSLPTSGAGSLAYHGYFNSNPPHSGPHRLDAFPNGQAKFKQLFGGPAEIPNNPVATSGSSIPTPTTQAPTTAPPTTSAPATPTTTASGGLSGAGVVGQSALFSDEFNGTSVDPRWSLVSPGGIGVGVSSGTAKLSIPAGTPYDLWTDQEKAPRLLQPLANTDFDVEARFASSPQAFVQYQGVLAEQDANDWTRFIVASNGYQQFVTAASMVNGQPQDKGWVPISGTGPISIRVQRSGSTFTSWYSRDGVNWSQWTRFTASQQVLRVGPYAGTGGSSAPAFAGSIDRFVNRLPSSSGAATTPPPTTAPPTTAPAPTTTAPPVTQPAQAGLFSDQFDGSTLNAGWTVVSPRNDVGIGVGGGAVSLAIPAGARHDLWSDNGDAPRLMQKVTTADFDVSARFTSGLSKAVQSQGILLQNSDGSWSRFITFNNGYSNHVHSASLVNGSPVWRPSTQLPNSGAIWLRVKKSGSQLTGLWSSDGYTWNTFTSFTSAASVSQVGVLAATSTIGGAVPGFTSTIDEFKVN